MAKPREPGTWKGQIVEGGQKGDKRHFRYRLFRPKEVEFGWNWGLACGIGVWLAILQFRKLLPSPAIKIYSIFDTKNEPTQGEDRF